MTQTNENNKIIAVYARVSSANQENEGTIETQLSAVKEYAKEHNLTIIRAYLDNGWSGDNIVRPELDKLRVDARKKIWQAVLIYDPDRLARRYSYQELICDELKEAGIEVLFVTTPSPTNGVEKILYGVQGLFAEYERAKITERFRIGKVRKAKEGNIISSEGPYGYTFIPKSGKKGESGFRHGYYEINNIEAQNVKLIFSWVANDNLTIRSIVKKLQELKVMPRKSKRGVWNTSTLSHLLRNKTYIGEGHYGASYATIPQKPLKKDTYKKIKKSSRRSKPEEEWIKISTPKIIDRQLFESVQGKLKQNFESSKRNRKNEYLLAGKIWCNCGRRRTGEGAMNGKHLYYRCTSRVYSFPLPPDCKEKGVNARKTDKLIWEQMKILMTSRELLSMQIKRWVEKSSRPDDGGSFDADILTKELSKMKEQQKRFIEAFGAGILSLNQFKEHADPINEKINSIQYQLTEVQQKREAIQDRQKQISDPKKIELFADKTKDFLKSDNLSFPQKREIINALVERIVASPQKLKVYGSIPVKFIDHVAFSSEYRYRWNSTGQGEETSNSIIPFELDIGMETVADKSTF